ncbi:MAG: MGMT family protein [Candidatus Nitrosocosmicus sp.]|nr:MGMT family protein [Candidatus Nitrosocosmicus sp.]MDN5868192.1 MGMT family protein [Candidatus Nitrosocosmicus sp.]
MKQISRKQDKNISKRLSTKTIDSEDVYSMLLTIPKGKVSTYGDLAKALGNPAASRHIGKILSKNPNPIKVPCHRVVMSNGKIGGYAFGTQKKKELLQNEGVIFADEYRVDEFSKVRYYPNKG